MDINISIHFPRIGVETIAAFIAALSVSPTVCIIDRAIVANASGLEPFNTAVKNGFRSLVFNPKQFFTHRAFLLIFGVQVGTYFVANNIEAICEIAGQESFYPKSLSCSFVNVTLNVLKDRAYARMFGTGTPKPMAFTSYFLFSSRDSMTMVSSFVLPDYVSQKLHDVANIDMETADPAAQLITPLGMQVFSTPLHLYGLDIYNRENASVKDRIAFIKKEYVKTLIARMSRILPAFGVGGLINKYLRKEGRLWTFKTNLEMDVT